LPAVWINAMTEILARLRTLIYYGCWFLPHTILWCAFSSATFWMLPSRWRYDYIVAGWAVPLLWGASWILGIRYRVIGREHVPERAIVLCNHQSTWEAMFMLALFRPQVPVLKQSLARIPFFGWAVRSASAVTVDRGKPRRAARKVIQEGGAHLRRGIPYLVFYPEGTRNPPGQLGKFSRGGGVLARQTALPLLPVSQNSGRFWRNGRLRHRPGLITVEIHPAIDMADCPVDDAVALAREAIRQGLLRSEPVPPQAEVRSVLEHAPAGQ
jgi:1-acyl-sn-glycerol-3-phosphate acyltransferase